MVFLIKFMYVYILVRVKILYIIDTQLLTLFSVYPLE